MLQNHIQYSIVNEKYDIILCDIESTVDHSKITVIENNDYINLCAYDMTYKLNIKEWNNIKLYEIINTFIMYKTY